MKIVRASAGSGKTYTLAKHYIDLLMASDDRFAYRHILAVTFTNKATAEMKARILRDLQKLSATEPKAKRILTDILHDYSAFSVSTIDRFFQQALKSFSREIGQFASYQVELDKKSLIHEAMDRILDGLSADDSELIDWLLQSVMRYVEQGGKVRIEDKLYEIGEELRSAEYRKLADAYSIDEASHWSKERLGKIREKTRLIIDGFEKEVKRFGISVKPGEVVRRPGTRMLKASPELAAYIDSEYIPYRTAVAVDKMLYCLGLATEFDSEYRKLLEEKNVMPLDDSNDILRKIIDGCDAPFVYEKLGVRYEHFLLDEFQDTSAVQWENFLPLLKESEGNGGKSLIVGDVKQSIYRWRDSDWKLLGEEVGKEFPCAEKLVLENNWRSCRTIVDFNSGFFEYAAGRTGAAPIYSDVKQEVKSEDPQPGSVRLTFTGNQTEAVVASIRDAVAAGAEYGDIAVLVRGHSEGGLIASTLIENGIPVISDDSLSIKSSLTVRRAVSLLSVMDNPDDTIGGFLAKSFNVQFPTGHHSLTDLCENLLRQLKEFDPESFGGETVFIQAFMDEIQTWSGANGNNLRGFLKHWEEMSPMTSSPQNTTSVRVVTIHKSKGLEFPYVIFPYAHKVGGYVAGKKWCHLSASSDSLGEEAEGIYPVELSSSASDTMFSADYDRERMMQAVDDINVFYVALTRAKQGLHVIAAEPTKGCRESLEGGKEKSKFGNMAELLYAWGGGMDDITFGQMYDFTKLVREKEAEEEFPASYPSFEPGGRFRPSAGASDFFGEDGVGGESPRMCGIRMHAILASCDSPADLPADLEPESRKMLEDRIALHPEWFGHDGSRTSRNETGIISEDGSEHRPDKVVFNGGKVSIIDYKFGKSRPEYLEQVRGYMELYRRMGYTDVEGFVWYVPEDSVVRVESYDNLLSL